MNRQEPEGRDTWAFTLAAALLFLTWVFTVVEGVTLILLVAFARGVWR